jgi:hypothetical protein
MEEVGQHGRRSTRSDQTFGLERLTEASPRCSASASSKRP